MGPELLIILMVAMAAMFFFGGRTQKKQQQKIQDFRQNLEPGQEVSTISGMLGTIVSVDLDRDIVVLNSEGSLSKWRIQAITEPPIIPAYVSDDEVDEDGNPLPESDNNDLPATEGSSEETSQNSDK